MGQSILDIGLSGINAAQYALSTASNNIANASTPGYAMEVVNYEEALGTGQGGVYIGGGVSTESVTRQYSAYLNQQLNQAVGMGNNFSTYNTEAEALNTIVGDPTAGLTSAFAGLYTGLQSISGDSSQSGTLPPALGNFQSIVDQFNQMTSQFDTTRDGVNSQLTQAVTQVNTLSAQIASLNKQIIVQQASTGAPPNELLDERDAAVSSLSQLVGAQTTTNQDGTINVYIGNGQSLVNGSSSYTLKTVESPSDPTELSVAYTITTGGTPTTIPISDSEFTSGTIGGLMQFRSQVLDPEQRQLGNLATTFATAMNEQNEAGVTLSGNQGTALFNVPQPIVDAASANTGGASLSAAFGGPTLNQLTGDNYTLSFDGTNYTLQDTTAGGPPTTVTFTNGVANVDGMTLTLNPAGGMAAGDSFAIDADTRQAGASLSMATTNANDIAAGSPSATAAAGTANTGTGTVTAAPTSLPFLGTMLEGVVTGTYDAGPPATLTFAQGTSGDGTPSVTVTDPTTGVTTTYTPTGTPPQTVVPFVAGEAMVVGGVSVTVSGAPVTGDTFALTSSNAPGDNSNAQAMSNLMNDDTMMPDGATFAASYASFVGAIGSAAASSTTNSAAQSSLITAMTAAQQSVSGVNLDQEATDMLQYEQLYQANSKVIQASSTIFTAILDAMD